MHVRVNLRRTREKITDGLLSQLRQIFHIHLKKQKPEIKKQVEQNQFYVVKGFHF